MSAQYVCGAGGERCPTSFVDRITADNRHHRGYLFPTADTVVVGYWNGCGTSTVAPTGNAQVSTAAIRWQMDWIGNGPDCGGAMVAIVRFGQPVISMRGPIHIVSRDLVSHRVTHTRGWPAPDLAHWAATLHTPKSQVQPLTHEGDKWIEPANGSPSRQT